MRNDYIELTTTNVQPIWLWSWCIVWKEILMSKITTPRLPDATEEYSREQVSQLVQTLEQVIFILNNTYVPETLRQDDERISWFLS